MSKTQRTFMCFSCHKYSPYTNQVTQAVMELFPSAPVHLEETRTYRCTTCGSENAIKLSRAEWFVIDAAGR